MAKNDKNDKKNDKKPTTVKQYMKNLVDKAVKSAGGKRIGAFYARIPKYLAAKSGKGGAGGGSSM